MLGKFVVLYGVNNLGKTTQAKRMVKELRTRGKMAEYVKIPKYDIMPSGKYIDRFLRQGNPDHFSAREIQIMYALNRTQWIPALEKTLHGGTWMVAEDYIGTGIGWGVTHGVSKEFLEEINSHLPQEDISILLDGERFLDSVEQNHQFETDLSLIEHARAVFRDLGREYKWHTVNANQTEGKVFADIWKYVEERAGVKW